MNNPNNERSLADTFGFALAKIKLFSLSNGIAGIYLVPVGTKEADAEDSLDTSEQHPDYRIPQSTAIATLVAVCVLSPIGEAHSRVTDIKFFGPDGSVVLSVGSKEMDQLSSDNEYSEVHRAEFEAVLAKAWGAEDAAVYVNAAMIQTLTSMKRKHDQLKIANVMKPIPVDDNGEFIMDGYTNPIFASDTIPGGDGLIAKIIDTLDKLDEQAEGEAYAKNEAADANEPNIPSP